MQQPLNQIQAGELLIELRKRQGFSQGDIAARLGYRNVNFISMIERAKSRVPVDRFRDFIEAYGATPEESLVLFRALWPELWQAMCHLEEICGPVVHSYGFEKTHEIYRRSVDLALFSESLPIPA